MDLARPRAILCHEFLHVRRRDWLWRVAEEVLRALFWFHPAVVWLIGQIRLTRKQAVDQEVVALAGSRRLILKHRQTKPTKPNSDDA
jgi:beta-lactamase regulating signal transducer with metallopeptidase domain